MPKYYETLYDPSSIEGVPGVLEQSRDLLKTYNTVCHSIERPNDRMGPFYDKYKKILNQKYV